MGTFKASEFNVKEYTGKPFVYGMDDCYSLIMAYYKKELGIELPKIENTEGWWDEGKNLYLDSMASAGFSSVENIEKHDILLINLMSPVPNHAAIYLGDEKILHHVTGRLSRVEPISGFWLKNIHTIARHTRK